ncbi:MAG: YbhB/YbcL family Raf kinase inhibitor-like protein [Candidatus Omnitrophica bacterium]|nr:YbhB/YbcL family Raf kinase inhibitor-like protein [Candidatus Omnitrophota bacterium]
MSFCFAQTEKTLKLSSPSFQHNSYIPYEYTCDGKDINPELRIEGIPQNTETMALIVDDPDAPMGTWVHWVVFNIPAISAIKENSIPGTQGKNDFGKLNWGGPCPPSGTHRYFFKLYCLDTTLSLKEGATKNELERAMEGHILASAELIGLYKRLR